MPEIGPVEVHRVVNAKVGEDVVLRFYNLPHDHGLKNLLVVTQFIRYLCEAPLAEFEVIDMTRAGMTYQAREREQGVCETYHEFRIGMCECCAVMGRRYRSDGLYPVTVSALEER